MHAIPAHGIILSSARLDCFVACVCSYKQTSADQPQWHEALRLRLDLSIEFVTDRLRGSGLRAAAKMTMRRRHPSKALRLLHRLHPEAALTLVLAAVPPPALRLDPTLTPTRMRPQGRCRRDNGAPRAPVIRFASSMSPALRPLST
eukprot:358752-Chlamydomonas_euryale.AAC.18